MSKAPPAPDRLPLLEHNGKNIEVYHHHGFSIPNRGPRPSSRILYAARDNNNERHWRRSLHEIQALIDKGFEIIPSNNQR